jgi:regulatory protein
LSNIGDPKLSMPQPIKNPNLIHARMNKHLNSGLFTINPDLEKAKKAAFQLLGRRAYTRKEIRDKLYKRGFRKAVVEETLSTLQRIRAIDDRDFAARFVEERLRLRPAGQLVLRRDLARRGVDADLIEETLAKVFGDLNVEAVAFRLLSARRSRYLQLNRNKAMNRMYSFLARRGFSPDVVGSVTARAWDCIEKGIENWEEESDPRHYPD